MNILKMILKVKKLNQFKNPKTKKYTLVEVKQEQKKILPKK